MKKQFEDLAIGAPSAWAPQVIAGQARVVATFSIAGRPRKLWVAPTRRHGYCFTFERSFGGCRQTAAQRGIGGSGEFGVSWADVPDRAGTGVMRIAGDVATPAAERITATYADGTTHDVPFVWVSEPIAAGFFTYDIPASHWNRQRRLLSVELYGAKTRLLARRTVNLPRPRPRVSPPVPGSGPAQRRLPTVPPVPPSSPVQRGSGGGFAVVVGHNGAVQFSQTGTTPILEHLVGKSAGFSCFRLTKEFGIFTVRGLGQGGRFAAKVGFRLNGVGTPVDGCEVQTSIGRRWPDVLGGHAAAEVPLSAEGRRFFADRAAARDLALFVRSRRMHELRAEPAAQAKRDIEARFRHALLHSAIRVSVAGPSTLRFSERSPTGKAFHVTIRNGRLGAQNLKPYALVF